MLPGAQVEDPLRWAAECAGPSANASPASRDVASEDGVEQEGLQRGPAGTGAHGQGTRGADPVGRGRLEAEKTFGRVKGYAAMSVLLRALGHGAGAAQAAV